MSNPSYVVTLFGGLDSNIRRAMQAVMDYVLKTLQIGPVEDKEKAGNFNGVYFKGVTSSVANQEFVIRHGLNEVPYMAIPVLPLNVTNAEVVDLINSTLADANNIYLKSGTTGATFYLYVEV